MEGRMPDQKNGSDRDLCTEYRLRVGDIKAAVDAKEGSEGQILQFKASHSRAVKAMAELIKSGRKLDPERVDALCKYIGSQFDEAVKAARGTT